MAYTLQESYDAPSNSGASAGWALSHFGQTFKAEANYTLTKVELKMYKAGTPPNITVEIQNTTAGKPNNNVLATQSVDITGITEDTDGEWVAVVFDTPAVLTNGTTYAVVVADGWTDGSNQYAWRQNTLTDAYADGQKYYADDGVVWSSQNYDLTFKNYSGTGATYVDFAGAGGGTGGGSADLFMSGMPVATVGATYNYKRLVVAGNDEIWYEDV